MTGIIYGSTTGNTENVAKAIAEKIEGAEVLEVSCCSKEDFEKFDLLLLGSSTWGMGDLQDDWEVALSKLKEADLSGKKVGFFGCGDQDGYSDTFANALGTLYEAVKDKGIDHVGAFSQEGFDFEDSSASVDGSFVGLVLDEDNQSDKTDERISEWVGSL